MTVLALNYRPFQGLLWRHPNAHQRQVYNRLLKLIRACDRLREEYPHSLQVVLALNWLLARLWELESFSARSVPKVVPSPGLP